MYYPGAGEVSAAVAVNVLNRSHTITAEVVIGAEGSEGVLAAHGGRFAGYSLFVKDQRLHYVHNYVGLEEHVVSSSVELPAGPAQLRYEFERTGEPDFNLGRGAPGIGRLYLNDQLIGEGEIPVAVPLAFALSGEGLCVGWDSLSAAATAYVDRGEFRFDGELRRVVIEVLD